MIQTIVAVKDASFVTLPSGNISGSCDPDSSIRFNFNLADLYPNQKYLLSFDLVSHTGDDMEADWCDDMTKAPLNVGHISMLVWRSTYDTTYRFLDVGNNEENWDDGALGCQFEMTVPVLRALSY